MRVVKSIPGGGKAYSGTGMGVWGKAGSKGKTCLKDRDGKPHGNLRSHNPTKKTIKWRDGRISDIFKSCSSL